MRRPIASPPSRAEALAEWQDSRRRPIAPDRLWWRGLSRRLGRPVGATEARHWPRLPMRDTQPPDRLDGRPAHDLHAAGATVGQAAAVYEAAAEASLWACGYGSPHSPPAVWIWSALRRGIAPDRMAALWSRCGERPTSSPERRYRTLGAIERVIREDSPESVYPYSRAQTRWGARIVERLADRYGLRGHLAGLGAVQAAWQAHRAAGGDAYGTPARALLWDALPAILRLPLWRLRQAYASPAACWRAVGIEVHHGARPRPPAGESAKLLARLMAPVSTDLRTDEILEATGALASCLGQHAPRWVAAYAATREGDHRAALHDAAQCLPPAVQRAGLPEWIARHAAWVCRETALAAPILRAWSPSWADLPPAEIRARLARLQYAALPEHLQAAAADVGLPAYAQEAFAETAARALAAAPDRECIPPVRVDDGHGHTLESLPRGDPRGPWLGVATDCCQHPSGAGASCAQHGSIDPKGGFWVVRDAGKIVAQSWIWRRGDAVAADNIEALGRPSWLLPIYQRAARALLGRMGIRAVLVGEGASDCDLSALHEATHPAMAPYGCYSDAGRQRLLAGEVTGG